MDGGAEMRVQTTPQQQQPPGILVLGLECCPFLLSFSNFPILRLCL